MDTENIAKVIPAGIVIVAGTVAAGILLDKEITRPPAGAGVAIVMVPVLDWPPWTEVGLRLRVLSFGLSNINVTVFTTVPYLANSVTVLFFATGEVVTANVV